MRLSSSSVVCVLRFSTHAARRDLKLTRVLFWCRYDPRCRPWYWQAKQQGQLTFTAPYLDATSGQLTITAAMPIYTQDATPTLIGE